MRYLLFIFLTQSLYSQVPPGNWEVVPYPFSESDLITVTVSEINSGNLSGENDIFLWTWYTKSDGSPTNPDSNWNGQWNNSDDEMKMVNNQDGSFSYTFRPTDFYGDTGIERIGLLAKSKDGSGDKKTQDHYIDVGIFSFDLLEPLESYLVIDSGASQNVRAETDTKVNFALYEGGELIHKKNSSQSYSYLIQNISENSKYYLRAEDVGSGDEITRSFEVIIKPDVSNLQVPYPSLEDGVNYLQDGKVVFLLFAPGKEFVQLNGSFNNWDLESSYLMNYDPVLKRFWYVLDDLSVNEIYSYQYVVDGLISIADPFSELILDSNHDSYLCLSQACGFDDLPSYPSGNKHAASVLVMDRNFNWEDQGFIRPKKEELIIYEILVRDFDKQKSFKSIYDKLDYIDNLGVNAIELMPVNEFDGNESWGYNPSFHMAIDKAYGSPKELKKLINECHKRGIAVIVDVVYNHATSQNPYYRLWNTDPNSYDGDPTQENDFFQISPVSESYLNYFNDINHEFSYVRDYMKRVNSYLIKEYHIDGLRFDLTKGFTNESTADKYLSSRVNYLKSVADDVRSIDPDSYIIFEHFQGLEEKVFSDNEILTWGEENYNYNEATMGYDSDFSGISYKNRGFSNPTLVGFMESHDKERLMYKNLEYGNSSGSYDAKYFDNAINRMKTAGALFFGIPGPKMIWQFGELGYDVSINTCVDGTISNDCRLSNKESAFALGMQENIRRVQLYDTWSRIISLRNTEKIFHTSNFIVNLSSDLKYIQLFSEDSDEIISELLIIGNFGLESTKIPLELFPDGKLYDIFNNNMEVEKLVVSENPLQPGQFFIIADGKTQIEDDIGLTLSAESLIHKNYNIYPNPFTEKLNVQLPTWDNYDITFTNSNGKKIDNTEFEGIFLMKDVSEFSNGIYFLKVKSSTDSFTLRVIKN